MNPNTTPEEFNAELEKQSDSKHVHVYVGHFNIDIDYKETQVYKTLQYIWDNHVDNVKWASWKEANELLDTKISKTSYLVQDFNSLQSQAYGYHYFLPHGYTEKPREVIPGQGGMDFKNTKDEYDDIRDYCDFENTDVDREGFTEQSLNSIYYHAAKAHWVLNDIREQGAWNPIQGRVMKRDYDEGYRFQIHPGSIRSGVFDMLSDDDLEFIVYDKYDLFKSSALTLDEFIEKHIELIESKNAEHNNISFNYANGYIETSTGTNNLSGKKDFRQNVFEHNKKVTQMAKGKRVNIYVGYDSRHGDFTDTSIKIMKQSIIQGFGGGDVHGAMTKWDVDIKPLDVSKIPEYTREYANQSTEFTYSRFLIPYLENYEGFSIFVDNDFIFQKSILPLFYFLNTDDAVACVKYKFDKPIIETKFNGEKNVPYPKKLWSSMMIFNNGHEDCRKLTPEVVNTQTGQYLHQFEWTDKISEIPERWIITEGYDTIEEKPRAFAIHYTRGGPWIKDMDTSEINMLDIYDRLSVKALDK